MTSSVFFHLYNIYFFSELGPLVSLKRKRCIEDNTKDVVSKFLKERGCSENFIKKLTVPVKKVKKYTKDEICEAILLRSLSSKAYEMLRKNSILPLPHKSTLSKKIKHFHCVPGMQSEFFNLLKLKLSVEDYWESQSIIMFDEMQMCQIYEYCPRLKQMFPAHKKVQVVLLR